MPIGFDSHWHPTAQPANDPNREGREGRVPAGLMWNARVLWGDRDERAIRFLQSREDEGRGWSVDDPRLAEVHPAAWDAFVAQDSTIAVTMAQP
jgi:hypothetical protein